MFTADISVVIPTFNRSALLRQALQSLLGQDAAGCRVEIIVVDNNSTDDTRDVVASLAGSDGTRMVYLKEDRQGNSFAKNTGIERANAPIVAFTDDDVRVANDWIRTIMDTFDANPGTTFIGGKVLPAWEGDEPSWLTPDGWAPLGAVDYGPEPFEISGPDPRSLLAGNLAVRRAAFDRAGMFAPNLQRVKGSIGSLEDHELVTRFCRAGERGMYVPALTAVTRVDRERLTKRYHRRWHHGHGRFYALLRDPEWERTNRRVLGAPAHVYRQVVTSAVGWLGETLRRRPQRAFEFEAQLRFLLGFLRQRIGQRRAEPASPAG
jgi:glycosyltransferase involved in cell wall biosynthesis